MIGVRRTAPVGVLLALTVFVSCRSSSERQAAAAAETTSQVAASPKQEQLWQEAAEQGAPGLERVPVVPDPIAQRDRSTQGPSSTPKPPQAVTIPPGVLSEIRILVFPNDPGDAYAGPGKVTGLEQNGEWIQLELAGMRGTLTVIARAGGKPLPLMDQEIVRVEYAARRDPQVPNDVIAIRNAAGAGIAHVVRGGSGPVTTTVPLFGAVAKQSDVSGSLLEITVPGGLKPVSPPLGQPTVAGDLAVLVLGNTRGAPGLETAPFAINVLVWKVP